jgi:hypothetical protein
MTPTLFAALVFAAGLFSPRGALLHVLMVSCLFGGAAAILLPALGGATITPAVMFLPFLIVRAWLDRGPGDVLRRVPKPGFFLALLAIWGALSAVFLPRLLSGHVQILTIDRGAANHTGPVLLDLRPVSGNITQTCYALGGVACFFAVRSLLGARGGVERFRDAVLLLASLNCVAAVVNLGEYYAGLPPMLDSVRTAGYAMFEAHETAGLLRIQGTFPETSAFSAFTLPLFAFSFGLWLERVRPVYSGVLSLVLLSLLLVSTSGTAYVALCLYACCVAVGLLFRGQGRAGAPQLGTLVVGVCLLFAAIGSVLAFELPVATRVFEFFDSTVLGKLDSDSGIERGSWNQQAWSNFLETYGLGVGLGSARASSYPLVLLSNVGVIGTLLFVAFVASACRSASGRQVAPVPRAARQAVIAALLAASVSGTVFDLGVAFYAFAAAASMAARGEVAALAHDPVPEPQLTLTTADARAFARTGGGP